MLPTSASPPQLFGRVGDRPYGVGAYDRKSHGVGAKVLGNFLPGSESSRETFAPGSESSRERKFHTMVLSLPGAKVLRSESSIIRWIEERGSQQPTDLAAATDDCIKAVQAGLCKITSRGVRFTTISRAWSRSLALVAIPL